MRYYIIVLIFAACSRIHVSKLATPLITVIKLHSIEEDNELYYKGLDELIDFESVYGTFKNDTLSAKQCWEQIVTFQYKLARDKKFTNNNRYYNYDIEQQIDGTQSFVTFTKNGKGEKFTLQYRGKKWVISKRENF